MVAQHSRILPFNLADGMRHPENEDGGVVVYF
jgi:hypothetical protein